MEGGSFLFFHMGKLRQRVSYKPNDVFFFSPEVNIPSKCIQKQTNQIQPHNTKATLESITWWKKKEKICFPFLVFK